MNKVAPWQGFKMQQQYMERKKDEVTLDCGEKVCDIYKIEGEPGLSAGFHEQQERRWTTGFTCGCIFFV